MFSDITASWLRKQVGDEQQSTVSVERCAEAKKKMESMQRMRQGECGTDVRGARKLAGTWSGGC